MKKAKIIKNGNLNIKNLVVEPSEISNLVNLIKVGPIDHIDFAMAFYLWSKDNIHPIPTGNGYRLKCEDYKIKHDLKSVVKYFEEKIYK